jgi:hypothetical protein
MKKLLIMLMVLFTTLNVNAKCDWSGYWMKKVNQQPFKQILIGIRVLTIGGLSMTTN